MSNVTPEKAWNTTPKSRGSRVAQTTPTRCNHYIDGVIICDAFPSWPVDGNPKQRRCEEHKEER